ncbi:tyrosine-type recombinase/integrase [Enterococcus sp. LJL51]|uniref:tyrosine-type recombinase/integrase n=1 Tax=Enterococcus sp. LJL51 TaxID=3416656 RepID=UPI003CF858DA
MSRSYTMHILKRWKMKQRELLFSYGKKDVEMIFTTLDNKFISRSTVYYHSNKAAKRLSLAPIGCHGFRHTHATLLFEAEGTTIKDVQNRLGHSDIKITLNIYTHVSEERKKSVVENLQKIADF